MSGVWKAPPTSSARTRRTPASGAASVARSTPSAVPAITTWPGALRFASQQASGAASHAVWACSSVAPRKAAMRPGLASLAAWVASARATASRRPASRSTAPAAISAVIWPSEWPANPTTSSARLGATASQATSDAASTDSWASRVRRRSSAGASTRRCARSTPVASPAGADRRPGRVVDPGQAGACLLAALAGEHDGNAQFDSIWEGTGSGPVAGDLRLRHLRITDGFTYCRVTSPFSSECRSRRPSRGNEMRGDVGTRRVRSSRRPTGVTDGARPDQVASVASVGLTTRRPVP